MKNKIILTVVLLFSVSTCFAGITNITKITEISRDGAGEFNPRISSDGLYLYYMIVKASGDPSKEEYVVASRPSPTAPFDNVTSAPFVNVMSATGYEGSLWVSDDGLRLYFSSTRDGTSDIFYSSRSSTSDPFSAPVKMAVINSGTSDDATPVLCNNELTIYFISPRSISYRYDLYRATRPNITSDFGVPEQLDEIDGLQFILSDVSEDELKMVLLSYTASAFLYTDRSSTSEDFSYPQLVQNIGSYTGGGSLNSDWSKIYFAYFSMGDPMNADLYSGNFAPPVPPTPTPAPVVPTPVPDISMAADRNQIESFTAATANPFCGAFDSQGRYIFFDQEVMIYDIYGPVVMGTNTLIRLSSPGASPSFSAIVTQSDLAAFDSRWNTDLPIVKCLDVLSDDSIVMLAFFPGGPLQKLMRIVPGSPPQISTIANWDAYAYIGYPVPVTVDRSVSPNIIYISYYTQIFKITADQVNATITSEWTHASDSYLYDLVIDAEGDVIAGGASLSGYKILKYDKSAGMESIVLAGLDTILRGYFYSTVALAKNPTNDDIFGLYKSAYYYPWTYSKLNIFKLSKGAGGAYTAADYVTGYQVLIDSDIAPYANYPITQLVTPGQGFAIDPSGNFLFVSNGEPEYGSYYEDEGSGNIIRIRTSASASAGPNWNLYE
jgi:hypothetical protein